MSTPQNVLKILILEDDPHDANLIQQLIQTTGWHPLFQIVSGKRTYVDALHNYQPDVVISDNSLPAFNASEALQILRKDYPHTPFILVSGTVSEEYAVEIIKLGADDFLLKDRLARLPMAIDAALKQRTAEKAQLQSAMLLRESEEKYRKLLESITDAFFALDINWCFTYINSKAGEILTAMPQALIGKNIWDEFPESVHHPLHHEFMKAMESQQVRYIEGVISLLDGWFEAYLYPSPTGMTVVFRDITEIRLQNETILEQNRCLKNIAWKQSHLLRSPVANVKGLVEIIKQEHCTSSYFNYIEAELERLDNIITEMVREAASTTDSAS